MKRQLQIKNGIAQSEWRGSGGMPVPPDNSWLFLDVTNRPEAQIGMLHDSATDTFSAPPAPPKVLGYGDFIELFTTPERKALRVLAATNADAADVIDLWRSSPIPLAAPKTAQRLQQLVTLGVLTAPRRTEILNS